ncbi:MAG: hypothetical protein JSU70_15350 [Phycisphaerales bacterium]|nr:MAG: hypothetical protein JSU70_15350 [Phycisphaerales bacterium]
MQLSIGNPRASEGVYYIRLDVSRPIASQAIIEAEHGDNVTVRLGACGRSMVDVTIDRDGSTASLYLNGKLENLASCSFAPTRKCNTLRIGSVGIISGRAGYFEGKIGGVRISTERSLLNCS